MTIFYCNGGEAEIIFRVLMGWDFFLCVHQLGGKVGVRVDELFVPLAESGKENHNFRFRFVCHPITLAPSLMMP